MRTRPTPCLPPLRAALAGTVLAASLCPAAALAQETPAQAAAGPGTATATATTDSPAAPLTEATPTVQTPAAPGQVEDIVVTATRSTTRLQQTPLAITAVTSQGLTERSFQSVQDIAKIVPNANFTQGNAAFGRTLQAYIRGVGQSDISLAFEPGVAIYVDDQYYALAAGSVFDLLDLDRVEVLRGPQGTVFGRNAIGGALNLIAKPPSDRLEGYVDLTTGSYNRQDIRAGFNFPLTDHLFFRVSGVSRHRRGYARIIDFACQMTKNGTPELAGRLPSLAPTSRNCVIARPGGDDVQAIRGALRYQGEGVDLTLTGDYTDDDSPVQADKQIRIVPTPGTDTLNRLVYQPLFGVSYDQRFITSSPFETYATFRDPIPAGTSIPGTYYNGTAGRGGFDFGTKAVIRNYGFGFKGIFDLADHLTATMLAGYRHVYTNLINDSDGSPLGVQSLRTDLYFRSYTAEPRINYTSELFDLTVGAFFYSSKGQTIQDVPAPFLNYQQNQTIRVDADSKAGYAQAVVRPFGPRLSLTLGGRYSDDTKDVAYDDVGVITTTSRLGGKRWDYRFGADYKLNPAATLYASVASGYRPSAFNPRPFQASQLQSIGEEELISYELGLKSDLFDRKLRVNVAGFYSDYSKRAVGLGGSECLNNGTQGVCNVAGAQVDPAVTGGLSLCRLYNPATDGPVNLSRGIGVACISRTNYVNTPGKIKGLEAEIEARPVTGLLINLSGGYTDFNAPELRNDPLVVNTTPTFVPKWTAAGGISYDIPAGFIHGKVTPRLDAAYQSKISFNSRSTVAETPGRTIFNGRVSYTDEDGKWTVAVAVTNLFNKRYFYNIFDLVPFGQAGTEGQPGRPREWYLNLKRRF